MNRTELVIAGESALGLELAERAAERGIAAQYLRPGRIRPLLPPNMPVLRVPEEAADAGMIIVTSVFPRRSFLAGLQFLEASMPADSALVVSGFATGPTSLGAYLRHPGRVFSLGAVPPIERLKGCAVARGVHASEPIYTRVLGLVGELFDASYPGPDAPGMTLPRVAATLINEAAFVLGEGVAQAPDIDRAMQLGVNYPEGPLMWGDRIGLDEVLGCLLALYDHYGENRYRPAPALRRLVQAGFTGRLDGRGFYVHEGVGTVG